MLTEVIVKNEIKTQTTNELISKFVKIFSQKTKISGRIFDEWSYNSKKEIDRENCKHNSG